MMIFAAARPSNSAGRPSFYENHLSPLDERSIYIPNNWVRLQFNQIGEKRQPIAEVPPMKADVEQKVRCQSCSSV
jgi:hypothetical protein